MKLQQSWSFPIRRHHPRQNVNPVRASHIKLSGLNLSKGLYFDESSPYNPATLKLKPSYLTTWPHRNAQVRSHSLHSLAAPFSTPELRIRWNQSGEQFDRWSTTTRVIPHQTPNSIDGLFQLSFVDLSFHLFHWFQPSKTSRARFAVLQIRSQSIYLLQLSSILSFQLLLSNRICSSITSQSHSRNPEHRHGFSRILQQPGPPVSTTEVSSLTDRECRWWDLVTDHHRTMALLKAINKDMDHLKAECNTNNLSKSL